MKGYRMMLTRVRWSLIQRGVPGTLKLLAAGIIIPVVLPFF